MTTLLWVLGISLATSFLCSILEAVLLSVSHSYVALLKDRGNRAGQLLERMQQKIDEPIAAILTLNTIAHTMGATLGGAMALRVFGDELMAAFSAILTLVILVFSEIIPKTIGATFWKALAAPTAWTLNVLIWVMKPIIIPLSLLNRLITPKTDQPTVSRAELAVLAEIGRREGQIDEEEWKVMTNVMNLDQIPVGAVMTPRTEMVAIHMDATVEEAMDVVLEEGHTRLPVYKDGLDNVQGILLARDLWQADRSGLTTIRDIIRPAHFAPSSKPVEVLIPEMQRGRTSIVIVLDEFGGTAGLATFEDLIEEIVGEIQDEHDVDEPVKFQSLEGGKTRIWGGVQIREVNEHLELALPEETHETLAGHIFGALGRVGRIGDEVTDGSKRGKGRFRIIGMKGRRIEFVVHVTDESPSPPEPTDV